MDDFIARIGTFFYIIAIGMMVLFFASDAANAHNAGIATDYDYFFLSLILFVVGFLFRKRAAPPLAADRFRMIRKMREDKKKREEEKAKAQQQKK